jgi:peptide methionine sulfoxide reductase MsrB
MASEFVNIRLNGFRSVAEASRPMFEAFERFVVGAGWPSLAEFFRDADAEIARDGLQALAAHQPLHGLDLALGREALRLAAR